MTIKLSPVEGAKRFAERIEFGKVTSIEGNMIHVRIGGGEDEGIEGNVDGQKDNGAHRGVGDAE